MSVPGLPDLSCFAAFAAMSAEAGAPCPGVSFRRALRRLATDGGARHASLMRLSGMPPALLLPPPGVVRDVVFHPVTCRWPDGPSSFGAGAGPVPGWAGGACLSLVERRWDGAGRLVAKLRMGAFLDPAGALNWDFGIVARAPDIASLRAGLRAAAALAPAFHARLDLTPSSARAGLLARRLGARPGEDGRWRMGGTFRGARAPAAREAMDACTVS